MLPTSTAHANPQLVDALLGDARVCVVTGHYGVGKTNLAINLALAAAAAGKTAVLADFDLVNPYFRSSDYPQVLAEAGVQLVAPTFAGTALDNPSVGGRLFTEIELALGNPNRALIVDVGGDDAGATALGRFAAPLQQALGQGAARLVYVVNAFRNLTQEPGEAAAVLREIEAAAHLQATGVANNSHLCEQTEPADVEQGRAWARAVAEELGLTLVATAVPARVFPACAAAHAAPAGAEPLVAVERHVTTPWQ